VRLYSGSPTLTKHYGGSLTQPSSCLGYPQALPRLPKLTAVAAIFLALWNHLTLSSGNPTFTNSYGAANHRHFLLTNLTEAVTILFSTLEPSEVILRHSHVYQTLRRQTDKAAILFRLTSGTPTFTKHYGGSRHLV